MAEMIPSTPLGTNRGEIEVFNVLKMGGDDIVVWQSAQISHTDSKDGLVKTYEADFIVYSPQTGIVVLEVKNIDIKKLISGNYYEKAYRDDFSSADMHKKIASLGGEAKKDNAQKQANLYLSHMKGFLEKTFGKQAPPHYCGVVLPSITRKEYESSPGGVLAVKTTFFRDDLDKIVSSSNPALELQKQLNVRFNQHSYNLKYNNPDQVKKTLKKHMGNLVKSDIVEKDWSWRDSIVAAQDSLFVRYGDMFKPERRLFFNGPAGSGKTLILANSACKLVKNCTARKVLFLCYNLSLVNYIKRICCANSAPMGENGIQVMPVFELASRLSSLDTRDCSSSSSYQELMRMAVESLDDGKGFQGKWDAIFVDEGQDFSADMVSLTASLLKKDTIFAVAADSAQSMYADGDSSKWLDIPKMEEIQLDSRYRSTQEIMAFAHDWLAPERYIEHPEEMGAVQGEFPEVKTCRSFAEAAEFAAQKCRSQRYKGVALNQMCILCTKKDPELYEQLIEKVEACGMLAVWPSASEEDKKRYDITIDAVPVSTIHSMKGMDFVHVTLVLPLSLSEGRAESLLSTWNKSKRRASYNAARAITGTPSHWRSVIYVGMTRARQSLTVIWYDDKA